MQTKKHNLHGIRDFINHYFGWRNWAVLVYNSVFENMFVIFFIALSMKFNPMNFIIDFFIFLLFSTFCTTYGYLINDFADKELDQIHGKDNTFKEDSKLKASIIVVLFFTLSLVFSIPFITNQYFLHIWIGWLFMSTAYSVKPFRLKERGKLGLFLVVIAQRVLPALLMFSAFNYFLWTDVIVITVYIFFRGFSSDLNHQIEDFINDSATETETFAVQAGISKTQTLFRFSPSQVKI